MISFWVRFWARAYNRVGWQRDLSFDTELVGIGYTLITKWNTIFNPGIFSLKYTVRVIHRHGKNVKIFIDKRINEQIRSDAMGQYPFLTEQARSSRGQ
jgi:hypothetical protein